MIIVDYFAGIYIEKSIGKKRKFFLVLSLIANIGILAFFKYFNFFNDVFLGLFQYTESKGPLPYLNILLPLGLSFHTFQAMSYTIEVYRNRQKAEKHFGIYALYVMFFPQLVAGPIERPQNLLHQFKEKHDFDYTRVTDGLKLIVWGLFKKVVIADRLALFVDRVYSFPQYFSNFHLVLATLFFSFQIFCDFSGYSDIAIGTARILGFKLMINFNAPYHSKSISEFWKRWHISLSSWFRDYLYIPLGGNRVPVSRWYLNIMLVFLISGLWHGADRMFIYWGAIHGFYMIFGAVTKDFRDKLRFKAGLDKIPLLQTLTTFLLVTFAWIFFRAKDLDSAIYIITHLNFLSSEGPLHSPFLSASDFIISVLLIVFMELVHTLRDKFSLSDYFRAKPLIIRWAIYYSAIFGIIFLGVVKSRPFIYFQF
ncbi:MAG: MBOAT family protein [Chitinivibrionales bacterium]|nr:MBOAT family protein [Chitinivibrionales bacterium]